MFWYLKVLKNYAVFDGRARRKEYWMFVLVNFLISFVLGFILGFIDGMLGNTPGELGFSLLVNVYSLAILVPSIAVGVRRMHDTDHSGWWILVPIVNLVFAVTDGTPGENSFGPDPKAHELEFA